MRAEIDRKQLNALFKKLDNLRPQKRRGAISKAFNKAVLLVEKQLVRNLSGPILSRRSGHLSQSIGSKITAEMDALVAQIGSGVGAARKRLPYADIHETGGTIRPRHKKYLTIPLKAAKTPAGVTRAPALDWNNTFIRNKIIYQKRGDKIVALFALKKQVTIPARRYLSRTYRQMKGRIMKALRGAIAREGKG